MAEYARPVDTAGFEVSHALFEALVGELAGPDCAGATHAELEDVLTARSRELMRQLMQDHLDLRAQREQRLPGVTDTEQVVRGRSSPGIPGR